MSITSLGMSGFSCVSVKHKRLVFMCSWLYLVRARISSILFEIERTLPKVNVGKGSVWPRLRICFLTPPRLPLFRGRGLWFSLSFNGVYWGKPTGFVHDAATLENDGHTRSATEVFRVYQNTVVLSLKQVKQQHTRSTGYLTVSRTWQRNKNAIWRPQKQNSKNKKGALNQHDRSPLKQRPL